MIKIALVGRPNVGKSALFNRLCGQRLAITSDLAGTTRDRISGIADCFGTRCLLLDTGGLDDGGGIDFFEEIKQQTNQAIEEADSLIMVVDGQSAPLHQDLEIARALLKTKKPLYLAVNKLDHVGQQLQLHMFHSLGISSIHAVSALHGFQVVELLQAALRGAQTSLLSNQKIKESTPSRSQEGLRVALIGRPNVGKSTLLNYILQDERSIVSPIAGTTRDSIDVTVHIHDSLWTFIDTAGIRKKRSEHAPVDKFAALRTESAIERSDVCLLLLDAEVGLTALDAQILQLVERAGKSCVLLFNKWDLVRGFRMEHCLKSLHFDHSFVQNLPTLFISSRSGRNVEKIFPLVEEAARANCRRISTGNLNRFIEKTVQRYHPPAIGGKRLRIYYLTQVSQMPPHFVLFVNRPSLMEESYKRYLINQIRAEYGFGAVPFRLTLRAKEQVGQGGGSHL